MFAMMADAVSGILVVSGSGLIVLAAVGAALADGLREKLLFLTAARPGLWSLAVAVALHWATRFTSNLR